MKNVHNIIKRKLFTQFLILCVFVCILHPAAYSQSEANYKSFVLTKTIGYIYWFAFYTKWETESIIDNKIIISVFSSENEANALKKVLDGKKVNNNTIVVKYIPNIEVLEKSNFVYIGYDWNENTTKILEIAKEWKAISFGYSQDFLDNDGLVQFLLTPDSVDFKINLDLLKSQGLEIHPRVLELAKK